MSTSMLICNEGKDDKKYHIAYQMATQAAPVVPYCRSVGHLDHPVQVRANNPKVCEKCLKAAGMESVTMPAEVAKLMEVAKLPAVEPTLIHRDKLRPFVEELFGVLNDLITFNESITLTKDKLVDLQYRLSNTAESIEHACGFNFDPNTGKCNNAGIDHDSETGPVPKI